MIDSSDLCACCGQPGGHLVMCPALGGPPMPPTLTPQQQDDEGVPLDGAV